MFWTSTFFGISFQHQNLQNTSHHQPSSPAKKQHTSLHVPPLRARPLIRQSWGVPGDASVSFRTVKLQKKNGVLFAKFRSFCFFFKKKRTLNDPTTIEKRLLTISCLTQHQIRTNMNKPCCFSFIVVTGFLNIFFEITPAGSKLVIFKNQIELVLCWCRFWFQLLRSFRFCTFNNTFTTKKPNIIFFLKLKLNSWLTFYNQLNQLIQPILTTNVITTMKNQRVTSGHFLAPPKLGPHA